MQEIRQHTQSQTTFSLRGTRKFTFTDRGWKTNFYQLQC